MVGPERKVAAEILRYWAPFKIEKFDPDRVAPERSLTVFVQILAATKRNEAKPRVAVQISHRRKSVDIISSCQHANEHVSELHISDIKLACTADNFVNKQSSHGFLQLGAQPTASYRPCQYIV